VTKEFLGSEGLIDPPVASLAASQVLLTCRRLGISYEFYTRLEQYLIVAGRVHGIQNEPISLAQEAPSMRRHSSVSSQVAPASFVDTAKGRRLPNCRLTYSWVRPWPSLEFGS